MTVRVELVTDEHGPVVRKTADGADLERLAREAAVLERASHPGVCRIVRAELSTGLLELRHAGAPLRQWAGISVDEVVSAGYRLASTVAHLHACGVVHGRIDADHVVLNRNGDPIVVGFGDARVDSPDGEPEDVAALGRLLDRLLADPVRWSPSSAVPRRHRRTVVRQLREIAARAAADDPDLRPPAHQLSRSLRQLLPPPRPAGPAPSVPPNPAPPSEGPLPAPDVVERGAVDPGPSGWSPPVRERMAPRLGPVVAPIARRASPRLLAVPVVAAVGLVVGVIGMRHYRPVATSAAAVEATSTTLADTSSTSARPMPATANCGRVADPDPDDGCEGPVTIEGRVATVGDLRIAVGAEGDVAAIGDWDCDGTATAAVLRPSTGAVFVFDGWPSAGAIEQTATTVIPGAVRLMGDAASCPTLRALGGDGTVVAVEVAR